MEIRDQDLIAKEFRKHEKCYRNYTQILYKNKPSEKPVYDRGNYESICRTIEEDVIKFNKCISMKTIIEAYSIGKGQHQYRSMLKNRLIKTFGNKILFVTPESNSQQVIISENCLHEQTLCKSFEFCMESVAKKSSCSDT